MTSVFATIPKDIIYEIGLLVEDADLNKIQALKNLKKEELFNKMRFERKYGDPDYMKYQKLYNFVTRDLYGLNIAEKLEYAQKKGLKKIEMKLGWFDALDKNDQKRINEYINEGIDINMQNGYLETGLLISVSLDHKEIFRKLLQHGANVHIVSHTRSNPLMIAVRKSDNYFVKPLIDADKTPNKDTLHHKNYLGTTPLMAATKNEDVSSTENIKLLLESDPDLEKTLLMQDRQGNTALMLALQNYKINNVKLLVDADTTPNKDSLHLANNRGQTPLIMAISPTPVIENIELLLKSDPDLENTLQMTDSSGKTVFKYIGYKEGSTQAEIYKLLEKYRQ